MKCRGQKLLTTKGLYCFKIYSIVSNIFFIITKYKNMCCTINRRMLWQSERLIESNVRASDKFKKF